MPGASGDRKPPAPPLRRVTGRGVVAVETTLLAHGLGDGAGLPLARRLDESVRAHGARLAVVGVLEGVPIVGMTFEELEAFLARPKVHKANIANLDALVHRRASAGTTVSATVRLAAGAGVRVMATGGLGGVHRGMADRLDVSADLAALARHPVAVVCSGVKAILDVESTREMLEALGVPVVGVGTDDFPAFYLPTSRASVDARYDDVDQLAGFVRRYLAERGSGVLVVQPVPADHALDPRQWQGWLEQACQQARGVAGRDATPAVLGALHQVSGGATLRANLALVESNAQLAARLAHAMARA